MDPIEISEIIRTNRKSIGLEVRAGGKLIIRAPHRVSASRIAQVIEKKRNWILTKQKLLQDYHAEKVDTKKDTFYYMGKEYPVEASNSAEKQIDFQDRFIIQSDLLPFKQELMVHWYKFQAKIYLIKRTMELSQSHGVKINQVKISSARRRWGSCSSNRNINLAWRMIQLPKDIIDYVIIHELAHINEMNHSKQFWLRVEEMMSDYKSKEKWLKNNSHKFTI